MKLSTKQQHSEMMAKLAPYIQKASDSLSVAVIDLMIATAIVTIIFLTLGSAF